MVTLKNVLKVEDPQGFIYYLGTITPDQIKDLTFVPVVVQSTDSENPATLTERDEHGYQRAGDPKRMGDIKQFILANPRAVVPPVLLSARGKWTFEPGPNKSFGTITAHDLAAIIDGQHRLGGLWRLVKDDSVDGQLKSRPIPFMLIDNLDIKEEQKNFIDINDNQKGVKKSLLRFLEKDKRFAGQAAYALMEDENSVFKGRITIQKKEDWSLILFGAAQDCVVLTFSPDFCASTSFRPEHSDETSTRAIELLLEFWEAVSEEWVEFWSDIELMPPVGYPRDRERYPGTRNFKWRLLEETGLRATSRLGSTLFKRHWIKDTMSISWDGLRDDLKALSSDENVRLALTKPALDREKILGFDPDLKSTGKAGVNAIYRHLENALLRR